jgi:hypothetical protein
MAFPLLGSCQSSNSGVGLCQSEANRRIGMKHQRRFETDYQSAPRDAMQIRTLIANLSRSIEILNCDIETEEERVRVRDIFDPAYPVLARALTARRENLKATVAALQKRVENIDAQDREPASAA